MGEGILSSAIDNASEAAAEISKQKLDFVKLEKLLICFDDLERVKPEMLSDNQILGYINSLVEDNNIKVIIVANEGKLNQALYSEVKEKTIGNTIHFQQNFFQVFDDILQKLQNPTDSYLKHLRYYKNLIYDFLAKENNEHINYRTLSYFLNNYMQICHAIQSGFNIKDLDEKKEEILEYCLKFSLMICVEYKKGKISFRNSNGLETGINYFINKLINKDKKVESYTEKTVESYFQKDEYTYYDNLYNYLTGGDSFEKELLKIELCKKYHIIDQEISESYKVYNELSNRKYKELSDKEYIKLTRELKASAFNGEYLIQDYLTIFYYIAREGNVLNLNLQKLTDNLIRIIRKLGKTHVYSSLIETYNRSSEDSPFEEYYSRIRKVITDVNLNAKSRSEKQADKSIEYELENNYQILHKRLIEDTQKPFIRATLSGIKPVKFYRVFKKADNFKKSQMLLLFSIVFNHISSNNSKQDFEFTKELKKIVDNYTNKTLIKNVSGRLFLELQDEINRSLTFLNSVSNFT